MQIDALVFQAAPQPLDEHVVHPTAPAVHRDAHRRRLQQPGELRRGELAALIGVEDLRPTEACQRFLCSFNAKLHVQCVRQPPGQHLPGRPVHHRNKVKKAPMHRDIRDIRAPHLVRPVDRQPSQQIRIHPVARMRHCRSGRLIDRRQAHQAHQPAHPLAPDQMTLAPQVPRHLPCAIPRHLQELTVDQPHQSQVQRRLAARLVIQTRAVHRQQLALSHHRQRLVRRRDQPPPPIHAHRPEAFAKKSRSTSN